MKPNQPISLGLIGTGRIAAKFVSEIAAVPDFELVGVYNPNIESAKRFSEINCSQQVKVFELLPGLLGSVDAVYIASPHFSHYEYSKAALEGGVHVLCEKPISISSDEVAVLYSLAREKRLAFVDGIKTAYYPGFACLEKVIANGEIGEVVAVDASFTKLVSQDASELRSDDGGSVLWLASYPLYAISRFLGTEFIDTEFYSLENERGVDIFTRGVVAYKGGSASFKVGFGAKTDGDLVVTGTKGFAVVPAPWWNTKSFWLGFEDPNEVKEYSCELDGYGLRYEIEEFARLIQEGKTESEHLTESDSAFQAKVLAAFVSQKVQ